MKVSDYLIKCSNNKYTDSIAYRFESVAQDAAKKSLDTIPVKEIIISPPEIAKIASPKEAIDPRSHFVRQDTEINEIIRSPKQRKEKEKSRKKEKKDKKEKDRHQETYRADTPPPSYFKV
jgi:hypothetical protein